MKTKNKEEIKYTSKQIKVLRGLEGIRKKPTLYIGSTDEHGLWTLVREVLDNAVDEYLAGRNNSILIRKKGNTFWIADSGSGIPVEPPPGEKESALRLVTGFLHAGAKFDGSAYSKGSTGTHGIGIKAVNALSDQFEIWTKRDAWYSIKYRKGKLVSPVTKENPPFPHKKGTIVKIVPDPDIFQCQFNPSFLIEWCELVTLLCKIKIDLYLDGKHYSWYRPDGIKEYLTKRNVKPIGQPLIYSCKQFDLAFQFIEENEALFDGYTNALRNTGTHVQTFFSALWKSLNSKDFTVSDLREGIIGFINVHLVNPQFTSQTKEKLVDERVKSIEPELIKIFSDYFAKNKRVADFVRQRATKLCQLRKALQQDKKAISTYKKRLLPGKFAAASNCKPELRECYIVEGDSAGGTSKRARDKSYQEVLPLKGKLLNVYKYSKMNKILKSEEVANILSVINYDPSRENPLEKLRVGKIILLSDPDPDGYHINMLVLGLFAKLAPQLFEQKRVFVVKSPKYIYKKGGKYYYADKMPKVKDVQYVKGWGEVNVEILRDIAFNPKTRRLIPIDLPSPEDLKELNMLLSEDVGYRRKLLGI